MDTRKSGCATCKHVALPSGIEPCCNCIDYSKWEDRKPAYAIGVDPGAPEGDRTNARLDWGESGPELIGPQDITNVDKIKDGPLLETARAVAKQITRLDYAIEGVRAKMSSIGLKFTDKALSRDELTLLVCQLNVLQLDLCELEEERKARRKAAVYVKDRDA